MRGRRFSVVTAAAMMVGSGALALIPAAPASAASPTCNWVASYAGAWVPNYGTSSVNVNCIMGLGDSSAGVRQLQHTLNLCYGAGLAEDSVFGGGTRAALINAQTSAGVTPDGFYGPNTRKAIYHQSTGSGCVRVP